MVEFRMKPRHLIQVPQFDEEHRQLFEITDQLRRELIQPDNLPAARQTFLLLGDYTRIHFDNEERLMQRHAYPDFYGHRQIHRNLLAEMTDMARRLDNWSPFAAKSFNTSLAIWLVGHIVTEDAKFGKFLLSLQEKGELTTLP